MRASTRFVRKLGFVAVFASVLAMLVGGHGIRQAHASAPPYQPGDLTAQGPFSPWFGSVTSDVSVRFSATSPPVVTQNPDNDDITKNRALVYMAIRDGINTATNVCVFGPPGVLAGHPCNHAPDAHDWPTALCDQVFQQIRAGNQFGIVGGNPFVGAHDVQAVMYKAVSCENETDGTFTAAAHQ